MSLNSSESVALTTRNREVITMDVEVFDATAEVAGLKKLSKTIRHNTRSSKLTRYKSELLAMHKAGANAADLQRWLKQKRINVVHTTVSRWLKKNTFNG